MALAYPHLKVLLELRKLNYFKKEKPSILELGEQNWYGDVSPDEIINIAKLLGFGEDKIKLLQNKLDKIVSKKGTFYTFDLAKLFYEVIFDYQKYAAIDMHGSPDAMNYDLNYPLPIEEKFDIVTNIGTGEHVFNQYNFFKTIHDLTADEGIMIHALPNQGGYDHGFYNYHPTFIFDLISANRYKLISFMLVDASKQPANLISLQNRESYVQLAVENRLSNISGLFVVASKPSGTAEFICPQQGYYSNNLSPQLREAWEALAK